MNTYTIMLSNGVRNTVQAASIEAALAKVQAEIRHAGGAWDMGPIFTGEVRVDTYFRLLGKRYTVIILKEK